MSIDKNREKDNMNNGMMCRFIAIALLVLPLGGCGHAARGDLQRVGCAKGAKVAEIEIRYDSNRKLIAVPDECRVAPGTAIKWFSTAKAEGDLKPVNDFKIEFRDGSPFVDYTGTVDAKPAGAKGYRTEPLRSREFKEGNGATNTYKYWIIAGGDESDPSIIIEPN